MRGPVKDRAVGAGKPLRRGGLDSRRPQMESPSNPFPLGSLPKIGAAAAPRKEDSVVPRRVSIDKLGERPRIRFQPGEARVLQSGKVRLEVCPKCRNSHLYKAKPRAFMNLWCNNYGIWVPVFMRLEDAHGGASGNDNPAEAV